MDLRSQGFGPGGKSEMSMMETAIPIGSLPWVIQVAIVSINF